MALVKSDSNELEICVKSASKPTKKQHVLDEESYIKVERFRILPLFQS